MGDLGGEVGDGGVEGVLHLDSVTFLSVTSQPGRGREQTSFFSRWSICSGVRLGDGEAVVLVLVSLLLSRTALLVEGSVMAFDVQLELGRAQGKRS